MTAALTGPRGRVADALDARQRYRRWVMLVALPGSSPPPSRSPS